MPSIAVKLIAVKIVVGGLILSPTPHPPSRSGSRISAGIMLIACCPHSITGKGKPTLPTVKLTIWLDRHHHHAAARTQNASAIDWLADVRYPRLPNGLPRVSSNRHGLTERTWPPHSAQRRRADSCEMVRPSRFAEAS